MVEGVNNFLCVYTLGKLSILDNLITLLLLVVLAKSRYSHKKKKTHKILKIGKWMFRIYSILIQVMNHF